MAAPVATTMSDIGAVVLNIENTLIFLMERNLLANGVYCHDCSNWMSIISRNGNGDK